MRVYAALAPLILASTSGFGSVATVSHRSSLGCSASRVASVVAATSTPTESSAPNAVRSYVDSGVSQERRVKLLDDALRSNSTAASELLSEVSELRSAGSQEGVEEMLNGLLSVVDRNSVEGGKGSPWWARFRVLGRVSRRARRASLRRVLDMSTPTVEEKESIGDDLDAARRRRSLVVLLRTLAMAEDDDETEGDAAPDNPTRSKRGGVPSIVAVERAARREARSGSTKWEDMTQRTPPGLETPRYEVLDRRPAGKGGYEVRRYDAFSVCSVPMNKPRPDNAETDAKLSNPQLAGAGAFGALAGYLFGKNDQSTSMKMTTPVLSAGDGDDRRMSFVLPSEYWVEGGIDAAPKPLEGSAVELQRDGGGDRAVVMFGGFAGKRDVEKRTAQLLEGLEKDEEWTVIRPDAVTVAQYNDPFTPPWKRRNEVSVEVTPVVSE